MYSIGADLIRLNFEVTEIQSEQPVVEGVMAVGHFLKLRRVICE
jgi:hypothetical protein